MTGALNNIFLTYCADPKSSDQQDIAQTAFFFTVSVGGGTAVSIEMDTGSTGVVIYKGYINSFAAMTTTPPAIPSYSSSGKTYTGTWVLAKLEIQGSNGSSFQTEQIPVFAADQEVAMMGVGVGIVPGSTNDENSSGLNPNNWNPFLNLQGVASQSYIVTRKGVWFGIDKVTEATFKLYQGLSPTVPVSVQGTTGPAYTAKLPLLLDTGISYTVVAPLSDSPVPTVLFQSGGEQFKSGLTISVDFWGDITPWTYSTTNCGTPGYPTLARSVIAGQPSIINTGRTVFAQYDYLADVTNNVVGIRLTTT